MIFGIDNRGILEVMSVFTLVVKIHCPPSIPVDISFTVRDITVTGDHAYRCGVLKWAVPQGLWGIFRVVANGEKEKKIN